MTDSNRLQHHCLGRVVVLGCVVGFLAACEQPGTEPDPPRVAAVQVFPGTATLAYLGATATFRATVTDQYGADYPSMVTWSSDTPTVFSVNSTGVVTGLSNGAGTLSADLDGVSGTATVVVNQVAAAVEIVAGDGQYGLVGERLRDPVGVRTLDAGGSPIPSVIVAFRPGTGGGSASPPAIATDATGTAATLWTLGSVAGVQSLTAAVESGPNSVFLATARRSPNELADSIRAVTGAGQIGRAGQGLPEPVLVRVVDPRGQPVPDATVRFTPSTGHGSADPEATQTDVDGEAATVWTLGNHVGVQLLTASIPGTATVQIIAADARAGMCDRTPQVVEAIVAETGAAACDDVTDALLAGVTRLDLSNKAIPALKGHDFKGLVNLENLFLGGNELVVLPAAVFADLFDLTWLSLDYNQLTELQPTVFRGLANLRRLELRHNRISDLPDDLFSGLGGLEELLLCCNEITEIRSGVFRGLSRLRWLLIQSNRLTDLPADVFADLPELEWLVLGYNELGNLPAGFFANLPDLEKLGFYATGLTELPRGFFAGLTNLRSLNLTENSLREIPAGYFSDMVRLEELEIRLNQLTDLYRDSFRGLAALTSLSLSSNRLSGLPDGIFREITNLRGLALHDNFMTELPVAIGDLPQSLEYLNLNNNRIEQLPPGGFSNFANLFELFLHDNRIAMLPDAAFEGLESLHQLSLDRNPGAPFALELQLERTDTTDVTAPGPASLVVKLVEGAPFDIAVELQAEGATLSADTAFIATGTVASDPIRVTRAAGSVGTVRVQLGTAPEVPGPHRYRGIIVVVGDAISLFR